jgi:hypothetical protein
MYGHKPQYTANDDAAETDMYVLKNARLLPDVCCCLSNTGNKIVFRINW